MWTEQARLSSVRLLWKGVPKLVYFYVLVYKAYVLKKSDLKIDLIIIILRKYVQNKFHLSITNGHKHHNQRRNHF